MNRADRRRLGKETGAKDIGQVIKDDRKKLMMVGLISSMEILKRDFGFNEEQLKQFSDAYLPEMEKQMRVHK